MERGERTAGALRTTQPSARLRSRRPAAPDNPLYATQLSATCSSVLEGLCSSLGGSYTFGASCPTADAVAECAVSFPNDNEKDIFYSTGGNPIAAGSTEPDDDCSGNGVVTWY